VQFVWRWVTWIDHKPDATPSRLHRVDGAHCLQYVSTVPAGTENYQIAHYASLVAKITTVDASIDMTRLAKDENADDVANAMYVSVL
jgi:hypothetical protein